MKHKLTQFQREFILEKFFNIKSYFRNGQPVGWKRIAESLINDKKCIVAGDDKIWIGGIGNFIQTKKAENTFGCLEYSFDVDEFLKSEWAKQIFKDELKSVTTKISDLEYEKFDLLELINNC